MWIDERRGHAVDWITQRWVELTGVLLEVSRARWLSGPSGSARGIGVDFFERWGASNALTARTSRPDDGLYESLETLRGPSFDPSAVHPLIADFYTRTAAFDLRIESRWSGPFRPLGWLISRLFARRLAQLNLPLSNRELQGGVDSRLVKLCNERGEVCHVGWVRTSKATGLPVFVGRYATAHLPGHPGACVQVTFPLPNGNAIILLRPKNDPGGGLTLVSDGKRLGDPGFYFTVLADPGRLWVRYVRTMKEQLTLRAEGGSVIGRHRFWIFGLPFMELAYAITGKAATVHSGAGAPVERDPTASAQQVHQG